MTPLPTAFKGVGQQKGYLFTVLKREGDVALLEKRNPLHESVFYEVAVIQQIADKVWPDGRLTPAHEAMPACSQWGVLGWSPASLEAARARFRQLRDRQEESGTML